MGVTAFVLHPAIKSQGSSARQPESRLEEAVGLARAISLKVLEAAVVPMKQARPATLFGGGSVERWGTAVTAREVDVVVVDAALTPVQQRNLEKAWNCKVIDRTGLILEIFGARARTKEGMLQVELAALNYQRSRLVRSWTHLERQRGGLGFVGGPGESQLELDRRLITERITRLKADLEQVKRTRALHRAARQRVPYPTVAFVGYTNAGKSTLFNRLTKSEVFAKDLLFATLDPTMRQIELPSGRMIILSDTVGFISDLPTDLIAAFRATLEEVTEADIVVHVRDIAHEDAAAQDQDVRDVLESLGLGEEGDRTILEVNNKIDLLSSENKEILLENLERKEHAVACSAVTGEGLDDLLALIDRELARSHRLIEFSVPLKEGAAMAWLYDHGQVVSRSDDETYGHLTVSLDPADLARFRHRYGYFGQDNGDPAEIFSENS